MMGLMFNLVERYLLERGGDAALERALHDAGFADADPWLDTATYPHADFGCWLLAAAAVEQQSLDDCARSVAQWALPRLMRRYASITVGYEHPLALLAEMPGTIYPQLQRMLQIHRSDTNERMELVPLSPTHAEIHYASPRRLCSMLEGAMMGLADHFGTPLLLSQPMCQHRGDDHCVLHLHFPQAQP